MSLLGSTSSCLDEEWQCRNSRCVPAEARCNGTPQCYDKSDEMNCGTFISTHHQLTMSILYAYKGFKFVYFYTYFRMRSNKKFSLRSLYVMSSQRETLR